MNPIMFIRGSKMLRETVAQWKNINQTVALIPTMGALHKGHISLVKHARQKAQKVIVSIFVNPLQFGPSEDYNRYPRNLDQDREMLSQAGVDALYAPDLIDIYPNTFSTTVSIKGPAIVNLEDAARPTHFQGVTTIVTKLLLQCLPNFAVFGEKDYQQLLVIKRLITDLDIPVEIIAVPTAREASGLALSSRNQYLSQSERGSAEQMFEILYETIASVKQGTNMQEAIKTSKQEMMQMGFDVAYLEARHALTLAPVHNAQEPTILLVAARLGQTRLIDNLLFERVRPDQPHTSLITPL